MKFVIALSLSIILTAIEVDGESETTFVGLSDDDSFNSESETTVGISSTGDRSETTQEDLPVVESTTVDQECKTPHGGRTVSTARGQSSATKISRNLEARLSAKSNGESSSLARNADKGKICYESILCDSSDTKKVSFNPQTDIKFLLLNDGNQLTLKTLESLNETTFDAELQTRVIIHGFLQNSTEPQINKITKAFAKRPKRMNIIAVNWGEKLETACYDKVKELVPEIGSAIASYLDFLIKPNPFGWHHVTLIGHSLGAHIAAHVARNVKHGIVSTIIGLDPAAPLFNDETFRLNINDTEYVEIIHTNGKCYGIQEAFGHADFYVNGGNEQPGCKDDNCHHQRAIELFAESLGDKNRLCANRCDSQTELNIQMGGEPNNNRGNIVKGTVNGKFCVRTAAHSTFGMGKKCIKKTHKKKKPELWITIQNLCSSIFR